MHTQINIYCSLVVAGCLLFLDVQAQHAWADSLSRRMDLLEQLYDSRSMEIAQVEAMSFDQFLQTRRLQCPPGAVPTINSIFLRNKDRASATAFLDRLEQEAASSADPAHKTVLLMAIKTAYGAWGLVMEEQRLHDAYLQALAAQQQALQSAALLQASRERDSLRFMLNAIHDSRSEQWVVDRRSGWIILGLALLLPLLLVLLHLSYRSRWRRRWAEREAKLEVERTAAALVEQRAQAGASQPSTYPTISGTSGLPRMSALVVEANRPIAMYLRALLSDRFVVETVDSGTEAMLRAGDLLPDLIVCDAVLNGTSGIEVVRQLKMNDRTSHIPMVLLVENMGQEALMDARRSGADTWFVRPLHQDELHQQVVRLLETRKQQHQLFERHLHLFFTEWRGPLPDPFLQKALTHIETNMNRQDFLPDDLARHMQLSNTHFARKLDALTGKEPQQLIREMRLEKAKVLLEQRVAPPQVIAELVGFSSPGTFTKSFRDYFGQDNLLLQ